MSQVRRQTASLPPGFEALEEFIETWGPDLSPLERLKARQRSTPDELASFYARAAPMLDAIFGHLDQFSTDAELPEAERRLYGVALGVIEAGLFMEVYGGKLFASTFHSMDQIDEYQFEFTA